MITWMLSCNASHISKSFYAISQTRIINNKTVIRPLIHFCVFHEFNKNNHLFGVWGFDLFLQSETMWMYLSQCFAAATTGAFLSWNFEDSFLSPWASIPMQQTMSSTWTCYYKELGKNCVDYKSTKLLPNVHGHIYLWYDSIALRIPDGVERTRVVQLSIR